MRTGMKFLFRFMLTFLVVLCVITVVVIFMQLGNGDTDIDGDINEAQLAVYISDGNRVVEESIGESDYGSLVHMAETDTSMWRASLEKPEGSEFWHYYPTIPDNAVPGDTVVLSAITDGFVGWEVDPNYANVELFNKTFGGDLVLASFIIPTEEFVVRALFNSGGSTFAPVSIPLITPETDSGFVGNLPDGVVGAPYSFNINAYGFPVGTVWSVITIGGDFPVPGLEFDPLPTNPDRARIHGNPTAETPVAVRITVQITQPAPSAETSPPPIMNLEFDITIVATPEIIHVSAFSDGMYRQPYIHDNIIQANGVPDGVDWIVVNKAALPPGLDIVPDEIDPNVARITGIPEKTGEFSGIVVGLTSTNVTVPLPTIKILPRPTFIPRDPFLPGMVGLRYEHDNDISVNLNGVSDIDWSWSYGGHLPDGIDVVPSSSIPEKASIKGTTLADLESYGDFNFTVRFIATDEVTNPPNIRGAVVESVPFTLRIWPRPMFTTQPNLRDGMDATLKSGEKPSLGDKDEPPRGRYVSGAEPDEVEYITEIDATRFLTPATTTWTWNISSNKDLPDGLNFKHPTTTPPTRADIFGFPEKPGDFTFTITLTAATIDNPNMSGGATSRDFNIRIWPRTYLRTIFSNAFVMRENEKIDINSDEDIRNLYRQERAVMPGTRGIIKIDRNFVRWDVLTGLNGPTIPDTMSEVRIQGPTNLADPHNPLSPEGWGHDGTSAFVIIKMPIMGMPDTINASNIGNNRDVRIGGVLSDASLRISPPDFTSWTVDNDITPRTLLVQSVSPNASTGPTVTELGTDLWFESAFWKIDGKLPNGLLHIDTTGISSTILGTPTETGPFPVTIAVTLPGTMRLELPWPLTIVPPDAVIVGAVNRNPNISLADLILLARLANGGESAESLGIDYDAAFIVTDPAAPNSSPNYNDFAEMSRWFSVRNIESSPIGKPRVVPEPMME